MASAYRYEDPRRGTQNRTRTGLAGVGTGNGGAAPYQLAALQPGMRGFWASGFGAAPTGATPDRQPDAPAAPAATQTAAPTVMAPDPNPVRTDAGEGAQIGVVDGEPGNLDLFGDLGINGKTVGGILGGAVGSLAGPLGGIAGALGGRALGAMFDGPSEGAASGAFSGNEQMGQDMNAAANNENASAGPSVDVADAVAGLAKGGRVTPGHLQHGKAAMQQHGKKGAGLRGAGMGGGYMGAFADGGPVMPPDDVNAALWRRAQDQAAPTPEMVQAARIANAPTEMGRGGMRFAENNARTDAYLNARFGGDPKFRPEAHYLGDPAYVTGAGQGMDDPLVWFYAQQRLRDAANANTQMFEGAPIGPDHPLYTSPAMRQPRFMGAYSMGGKVPNYAQGGMVDEQALAGPDPAGPDDGYAALDGGEYVVRAQQAQRPDYAPILEQMNQGTYDPASDMGGDAGGEPIYTYGAQTMDATTTAHAAALGDAERMVLLQAMQTSPEIEGALTALLGPEGMALLQAQNRPADAVDSRSVMAARAPLAGPPPVPGTAAPPGFPPPAQRRGGLAAVANG